MKKVFKIIISVLLFLGLIALICCYCIMPERTKESVDIVVDYMNRPLPIVGVSLIVFLGFIFNLYTKTSFGKKQYSKCYSEIEEVKRQNKELEKQNALLLEIVNSGDKENVDRIIGVDTKVNELTNIVVEVANTIPNAKVNAIADKVKGGKDNGEETIND